MDASQVVLQSGLHGIPTKCMYGAGASPRLGLTLSEALYLALYLLCICFWVRYIV